MYTFQTPEPISVSIEIIHGHMKITAEHDRTETTVQVRPGNEGTELDVRDAEATRVEYADGHLLIKGPKQPRFGFGRNGMVDVTIHLPAGSHLRGQAGVGTFVCRGDHGDCWLRVGVGDLLVGSAHSVDLHTGTGAVTVDRVAGRAIVYTASGQVRLPQIGGDAEVKNSNGATSIGDVGGTVLVKAANGGIVVDRAGSDVTATTANGDIRIGEVSRGEVSARTAMGAVEVGVRAGTATWLDAQTRFGTIDKDLEATDVPDGGTGQAADDARVRIQARTSYGNITVHRV